MSPPEPQTFSGLVQVRHIRKSNSFGNGGCLFAGYSINEQNLQPSTQYVAVSVSSRLLPLGEAAVSEWDCWYVSGSASDHVGRTNSFTHRELRVVATELYLVHPNGELVFNYLTGSQKFRGTGVGPEKVRKLWSRYGTDLTTILDVGDLNKLTENNLLTSEAAIKLIEVWQKHAPGKFISFLQSNKFPVKLGARVINYYGQEAEKKLNEDAFRLLAFGARWKDVDDLAQKVFGMMPNDERRLVGAIEAVLAQQFKSKHTASTDVTVKKGLSELLKVDGDKARTAHLVSLALGVGNRNGVFVRTQGGKLYHQLGTFLMERLVADRIAMMTTGADFPNIFMAELTADRVEELICNYEQKERKEDGKGAFALNDEQRMAVRTSLFNPFSVITGGAGTGKTTVLKCLYFILDVLGYSVIQMALSGKAAKRMNEATGRKARTIAGFLRKAQAVFDEHGDHTYLIVDESSMLDLQTTFRIFRCLPECIRIVLVGDPHQLPPIGGGLIFQSLIGMPGIPQVELQVVKRQENSTGIPQFALDVRNRRWARPDCRGVRFVNCNNLDIKAKVLELFADDPGNTQILCAVKKCALSGAEALNLNCQNLHNPDGKPIRVLGDNAALCPIPFRVGDRILFVKNDWERGTMNGSFATIIKAFDQVHGQDNPILGYALLESDKNDEEIVPLYISDFDFHDPCVMLGYAITVHKAQGSQWPRVIIPIRKNKRGRSLIVDCTWIYTALTRGELEVIFVGDELTAEEAVKAPSRAHERCVGFGDILADTLRNRKPSDYGVEAK